MSESRESTPEQETPDDRKLASSEQCNIVSSHSLFGEQTEVLIRHEQSVYRLKITKQGKLILNK